jgi:hypothetical protein
MLTCGRAIDSDEAKMLIHAAWSIERFRRLPPAEAAERLLENPAVRLGSAWFTQHRLFEECCSSSADTANRTMAYVASWPAPVPRRTPQRQLDEPARVSKAGRTV